MKFKVGDRVEHIPSKRLGRVKYIPPKTNSGLHLMDILFDGDLKITVCENSDRWFRLSDNVEFEKDKISWSDIWDSGAT